MDPRPFCRASTLVALLACILVAGMATAQEARQALYDQAIVVFRAVLINRPELIRVRLELARTFFLKGQDGLARRHFELVLAGGVPPPAAANIHRFLSVMRARKRWSGYFGAAFAPDSNLNAASESETIYLELGAPGCPSGARGISAPNRAWALRCGAASEHWRNLGRWVRVGTSLNLPLGFTLGTTAQMRRVYYEGSGSVHLTLNGGKRLDRTRHVRRLGPQPRLHPVRLQPPAGGHQRGPPHQRPGAGLRPQPRRVALRAAVLTRLGLPAARPSFGRR